MAAGARGHVAIGWTREGRLGVAVRDPLGRLAGPWFIRDGDPVLVGMAVDGDFQVTTQRAVGGAANDVGFWIAIP